MRVSVLIPTLNAAAHLTTLLAGLQRQSRLPDEIVVVDSASTDGTVALAKQAGAQVVPIDRATFDHGGTRNRAVVAATGDILVFLTQDVEPVDEHFLARLVAPLEAGDAAAAFARQVGRDTGPPTDTYLRLFNYPAGDTMNLRSQADMSRLGVRAYMLSNAASAVRRDAFDAVGGFASHVIMNEDMLLCARLLQAGHRVAYVPHAQVWHSHNYRLAQHFRRYFDIGVFMATHRADLETAPGGGTGLRFVAGQIGWLLRQGQPLWIPRAIAEAGVKWLGYQLGCRHDRLSPAMCRRLSMHKAYWRLM